MALHYVNSLPNSEQVTLLSKLGMERGGGVSVKDLPDSEFTHRFEDSEYYLVRMTRSFDRDLPKFMEPRKRILIQIALKVGHEPLVRVIDSNQEDYQELEEAAFRSLSVLYEEVESIEARGFEARANIDERVVTRVPRMTSENHHFLVVLPFEVTDRSEVFTGANLYVVSPNRVYKITDSEELRTFAHHDGAVLVAERYARVFLSELIPYSPLDLEFEFVKKESKSILVDLDERLYVWIFSFIFSSRITREREERPRHFEVYLKKSDLRQVMEAMRKH